MANVEFLVAQGNQTVTLSEYRKAPPPPTGEVYGAGWGQDFFVSRLPGGNILQFDLSKLDLDDYRLMKEDYQINASLLMLQMMVAQTDWQVYTKGEETSTKTKQMSEVIEEGIRKYWIPLVRALSQSFWAGYAPTVLTYELNNDGYYEVVQYKDMQPDQVRVDWKYHTGADNTKIRSYGGIAHAGRRIPGRSTLWYPLMMQNGDYYGRKLLKPAFAPWFFSQLVHLYTNRYFERFGEPTAVGYYPPDTTLTDPASGQVISAQEAMASILLNLRSRGVVTIPSERNPETKDLEWDLKYLESNMRGADFDRYLDRLDEEKSLALFTPVLMFRTGQAGSYNLGTLHNQVFQWMLNALTGDIKTYIDHYLITPLHDINFGPNAPRSEIRFRTLGRLQDQGAQSILLGLIQNGGAKVTENGLRELGSNLGIELEYLTGTGSAPTPPAVPSQGPAQSAAMAVLGQPGGGPRPTVTANDSRRQLQQAKHRLDDQVRSIFRKKDGYDREIALSHVKMGFKSAFLNEMIRGGAPEEGAGALFATIERDLRDGLSQARTESDALSAVDATFSEYGIKDDPS